MEADREVFSDAPGIEKLRDAERAITELLKLIDLIKRGECYGLTVAYHEKDCASFMMEGSLAALVILVDQLNLKLEPALRDAEKPADSSEKVH